MGRLELTHVELSEANSFVSKHHRHHKPAVGHRFSIGAKAGGSLVGVAIIGRPVARASDQKCTVEVTRLCTDGAKNACSFLYGAAARAAKALGYKKIQTFILESETGTTLVAAGWKLEWTTKGGSWTRASKPGRREDQPMGPKQKWSKDLA